MIATDHLSYAREQALGAINGLRVDSASATAMEDCVRLLAEGAPAPRGGLRARELRCRALTANGDATVL